MRSSNTVFAMMSAVALWSVGNLSLSAASDPKPTSETALGTADQRAVEALAIKIIHSQPVVEQIQKSTELFKQNPAAQTQDGRSTLNAAVHELAFAAALNAANSDPNNPKIVWIAAAPRTWFGRQVPGSRWGIDNPDNVYRNIPIDGTSKYEITGKLQSPAPTQFSFLLYDSFFGEDGKREHMDTPIAGLRDKDIKVEPNGSFKISVDSSPADGRANHIQSTDAARVLLVRNTFSDWSEAPLAVTIKRVDAASTSRPSDGVLDRRAAQWLAAGTDSVLDWVTKGFGATAKVNEIAQPFVRGGGWGFAANGQFKLNPDEALVVTLEPKSAQYLGFDLTDPWLVSREHVKANGSLNNHQAVANADGSFTYVIAAHDPQIRNWLDTGGLHQGHLLIRWQALTAATPDATGAVRSVQLVKLASLRTALPSGTVAVSPAERRDLALKRAAAYSHRYFESRGTTALQAKLSPTY